MHEFETFRKNRSAPKVDPLITIQRRGLISLNSAAHQALGSPVAVELLYNVEERIVGLRAVDPRETHSYILRSSSKSRSGPFVISATAFTHHYEIDTMTALRWVGYLEHGMLCIDLKTPGLPANSSRVGARRVGGREQASAASPG